MPDQRNNRIREHRARRGWTLYLLAEKLGTSAAQVSRLERSDRKLTQQWLKRISVALRVSQADLLKDAYRVPGKGQPKREAEEERLLLLWRSLNREAQDRIMRMLDVLTNHTERR
jgi:transcriptional regulator with XRE-family HTH domain